MLKRSRWRWEKEAKAASPGDKGLEDINMQWNCWSALTMRSEYMLPPPPTARVPGRCGSSTRRCGTGRRSWSAAACARASSESPPPWPRPSRPSRPPSRPSRGNSRRPPPRPRGAPHPTLSPAAPLSPASGARPLRLA